MLQNITKLAQDSYKKYFRDNQEISGESVSYQQAMEDIENFKDICYAIVGQYKAVK